MGTVKAQHLQPGGKRQEGLEVISLSAWCLSICPSSPTDARRSRAGAGSTLVSLQGAALKYLPSILEDVFGIFDSFVLG